jgi:plasmid stabilization system protein ParE
VEVVWAPPAQADLRRIFAFNLQRTLEWALRVDDRLWARGEWLGRFPYAGRPVGGTELRLLSVTDIQYVITYRVDGHGVTILRIHATREHRETE